MWRSPHVKSGKLRGIGVSSSTRSPILPDVPAIAEAGYPGYEASGWLGLLLPAKTPDPIVDRLYRGTVAVINMPEVRDQLQASGLDPAPSSPEAFRAYMKAEHAKWGKLIRDAGIRAD